MAQRRAVESNQPQNIRVRFYQLYFLNVSKPYSAKAVPIFGKKWEQTVTKFILKIAAIIGAATIVTGCGVAKTTGKVAALPFKAVYKTGEFAGKSIYHTGRLAGKGVYKTGEFAGKSVYHTGRLAAKGTIATGKGVYYVGTVPVKVTDRALETSAKVLNLTTQAVDLTGKVVTVSRRIQAAELETELAALQGASNVLGVVVDILGG